MGVWRGRARFKKIRKRLFMMSGREIDDGYGTTLVLLFFFSRKCWQYLMFGLYIITQNREAGKNTCIPTIDIADVLFQQLQVFLSILNYIPRLSNGILNSKKQLHMFN